MGLGLVLGFLVVVLCDAVMFLAELRLYILVVIPMLICLSVYPGAGSVSMRLRLFGMMMHVNMQKN